MLSLHHLGNRHRAVWPLDTGRATEQLAAALRGRCWRFSECDLWECGGVDHRAGGAEQGSDRRGQGFDHGVDYRQPSARARRVDSRRRRALPKQTFNQTAARISATSLGLGAIALITPTVFHRAAASRPADGRWKPNSDFRWPSCCVLFLHIFLLALFSSLYPSRALRRSVRRSRKPNRTGLSGNRSPPSRSRPRSSPG